MSISSIKAMPLAFRIHLHKELLDCGILTSCLNCEKSSTDGEVMMHSEHKQTHPMSVLCNEFKQQPPLPVVVAGCPAWVQQIPF